MNAENGAKEERYLLSIVVIGRNEAQRLPQMFRSLPRAQGIEWIYVDSGSTDRSREIALKHGAKVFQLDADSVYAPATGRYVGTKEAAGRWILYLDGDMALREEFACFLDRFFQSNEGIVSEQQSSLARERAPATQDMGRNCPAFPSSPPPDTVGFVGRTCNHYLDDEGNTVVMRADAVLARREMGPVEDWGRPAGYHGGAALYLRSAVLEAGSWNPALLQLEEVDLYSRVRARGGIVRALDLPMVDHYTPFLSAKDRLKQNFLPHWQGKKLYGAGQVVAARFKEGGFCAFLRLYPYPFLVFTGIVLTPLLYLIHPLTPLLFNFVLAAFLAVIKGRWYIYLVYLGNILQILWGINHYRPFKPRYRSVTR